MNNPKPVSLSEGIRLFEQEQRKALKKLTAEFSQREQHKTKFQSIYISKPEVRAKFDYFK